MVSDILLVDQPAKAGFETAKIISLIREVRELTESAFFHWPDSSIQSELEQAQFVLGMDQNQPQALISFVQAADFLEIRCLATRPTAQKKGFMRKLLLWLSNYATSRSLSIELEVHQRNQKAIELYLSHGFKLVRTRKRYYQDGGDALVFVWNSVI